MRRAMGRRILMGVSISVFVGLVWLGSTYWNRQILAIVDPIEGPYTVIPDEKVVLACVRAQAFFEGLLTSPVNVREEDIFPTGNCRVEIQERCPNVKFGARQYVDCITELEKSEWNNGVRVSGGCKAEVRAFKIHMYQNITHNMSLMKACSNWIIKWIQSRRLYSDPEQGFFDNAKSYGYGSIWYQLRYDDEVTSDCAKEVHRARLDAVLDYKMDPILSAACSQQAERFCEDVEDGEGRVTECLWKHVGTFDSDFNDCENELREQRERNAGDIRLNPPLLKACSNDWKNFCPKTLPMKGRVQDCLEDHRQRPDFSPLCKAEVENMMLQGADEAYTLDDCDIYHFFDHMEQCDGDSERERYEERFLEARRCLEDYWDDVTKPRCARALHRLTKRAAEDMRFYSWFDRCSDARKRYCNDVPDGMGRVFRCLEDHMESLKGNDCETEDRCMGSCEDMVFKMKVLMTRHIDFKPLLKQACSTELKQFCPKITHGNSAVKCLQAKVREGTRDIGEECVREIEHDQALFSDDLFLNYKLEFCWEQSKTCAKLLGMSDDYKTWGGSVLKCVSNSFDAYPTLTQGRYDNCLRGINSIRKSLVPDFQLGILLRKACKDDVTKYCADESAYDNRAVLCLRRNRESLSEECKVEEEKFSLVDNMDLPLSLHIQRYCEEELKSLCDGMRPFDNRAYGCLKRKLKSSVKILTDDEDWWSSCKTALDHWDKDHRSSWLGSSFGFGWGK